MELSGCGSRKEQVPPLVGRLASLTGVQVSPPGAALRHKVQVNPGAPCALTTTWPLMLHVHCAIC